MATEIIRAPSSEEVERKVADWKTAHPKTRIVQEVAAFSRDPERGGWRVCIDYEEPGDKA